MIRRVRLTAVKGTCSLLVHSQAFFPCRFRYPTAIKLLSTRLSSQHRSVNVKAVCETAWPLFNSAHFDGHSVVYCLELTSTFHFADAVGASVWFSGDIDAMCPDRGWWDRNGNSGVTRPCASSRSLSRRNQHPSAFCGDTQQNEGVHCVSAYCCCTQ